jgi:hypothetical protein
MRLDDGDLLTISADGATTRPIPEDARLVANQTTSLCQPGATPIYVAVPVDRDPQPVRSFQTFTEDLLPTLLSLCVHEARRRLDSKRTLRKAGRARRSTYGCPHFKLTKQTHDLLRRVLLPLRHLPLFS